MPTQDEEELREFREAFEKFPDSYARREFLKDLEDLEGVAALMDLDGISALEFVKMFQDGSLVRGLKQTFRIARKLMSLRLNYMKWRAKNPDLDKTGDADYDWDVSSYAYRAWNDAEYRARREETRAGLVAFCRELSNRSGKPFSPTDCYSDPKGMAARLFPDGEWSK
jgi:hypothetical protein